MDNNSWREMEKELSELVIVDNVSPELDEFGRMEYADLSYLSALMSDTYLRMRGLPTSLGMDCSGMSGIFRTYSFALMTANAITNLRNEKDRELTVVELGTGSGVNAVSALLADKNVRYIGYERNKTAIDYSKRLIGIYNLEDRAEIRDENFLTANMEGLSADVVINENVDSMLGGEPQLEAAKKILPYTNLDTLFVPMGFDIFLRTDARVEYFGRIDHSQNNGEVITFGAEYDVDEIPSNDFTSFCELDMLSYNGKSVLRDRRRNLGELNTSNLVNLNFGEIDPSKRHKMILNFEVNSDYNRKMETGRPFSLEEIE